MLLKIIANLGSADFPGSPFLEGETHDVAEPLASRLLRRRLAIRSEPLTTVKMEATQETIVAEKSSVQIAPERPAMQQKPKSGK